MIINEQEIKDASLIDDVLGEFLTLHKKGNKIKALCPFHDDKDPSLVLYTESNTYKCYSCGASGDSIKYLMEKEGKNYKESLEYLAQKYGIQPKYNKKKNGVTDTKKEANSLYTLTNAYSDRCKDKLPDSDSYKYMNKRGFSDDTLDKWHIGHSVDISKEIGKAWEKETAIQISLIKEKEDKIKPYFQHRVMFPILNHSGKVAGFGGRTLSKNKKIPKYINSKESLIYKKDRILYGLYQNRKAIAKSNECLLVEGYTDVMGLDQIGISNAVATCGTALSDHQCKLLKRYCDTVIIWRDDDPAGAKATERDMRILLKHGFNVKVVELVNGSDPCDWAFAPGVEIKKFNSIDAIIRKCEEFTFQLSPVEADRKLTEICSYLQCIESSTKQDLYINHISKLLKIDKKGIVGKVTEEQAKAVSKYDKAKLFIRVANNYYKQTLSFNAKMNSSETELKKWNKGLIIDDYVKKGLPRFLDFIPKYDNFVIAPDFQNHQKEIIVKKGTIITKSYNLIQPLEWKPGKGQFPTIEYFLTHLFGNENSNWNKPQLGDPLTMIQDCFKIKLKYPTNFLPVPCLVSKEQGTGKSTFLHFVKDVFGGNACVIGNEHLESDFNGTYATKLVICIDEAYLKLDKKSQKERLKRMVTDDSIFLNMKGIERERLHFFAWILFASNDELDFMKIDPTDTRFWIIKVKKAEKEIPDFRQKLQKEIPAFLHWCFNSPIFHSKETRFWFRKDYIITDQMKKITQFTLDRTSKTITNYITNIFLEYNIDNFYIPLKQLTEEINEGSQMRRLDNVGVKNWLYKNLLLKAGKVRRCKWPIGWKSNYYLEKDQYKKEFNTDDIEFKEAVGRGIHFKSEDWKEYF